MGALAVPALKVVGTALAGKATSKVLGDKPKPPAAAPEPPPTPLPDEEALRRDSRRKAARRFGALGTGRAATILSDSESGTLGA